MAEYNLGETNINYTAYADIFIKQIGEIITKATENSPAFVPAIVRSVNTDGTVNVYFPPDTEAVVTHIANHSAEVKLQEGDSVTICKPYGTLSNCWIASKSGTSSTNLSQYITTLEAEIADIEVGEGNSSGGTYLNTSSSNDGVVSVSGTFPITATTTNSEVVVSHATSGVAAGTYRSVTVTSLGHISAGTNPTTLSGYGITDAKIASGVITLGSNTITPLTGDSTLDATKLSGTASIDTTGNAASATTALTAIKASQDSNGNVITTTYATATALSEKSEVEYVTSLTSGISIGTLTIDGIDTVLYAPNSISTHYITSLVVGDNSTANANAVSANGNTYLNLFDDSTLRNSHLISGSGATTVTSDAAGAIVISSINTTYSVATTSANGLMSSSDKTKINGIEASADVNVIEIVNVNGFPLTITDKSVNIIIPTVTSALTNDSGFITATDDITGNAASATTATTATKLGSSTVGSATRPVYLASGVATACTALSGTTPIIVSGAAITHATSGVTASTYRSVTVNAYGHVTGGTNPTTISGYGITDAKIASGVITLGSNTITPLTASSSLNAAKLSGIASIDITGNAASATTATQDGAGNIITTTYAPIESPALTGTPTAPTATTGTNTTQIATTAFVQDTVSAVSSGVASFNGRSGVVMPIAGDYTAAMVGAVQLTGDTMSGALTISNVAVGANGDSLIASGNIVAGSSTKTAYCMIATTRKCSNDNNKINTSAFFTDSDGTSKFLHKTGTTTGTDDAYLVFDADGFKVGYSGVEGTAPTATYNLLDTNTGYTQAQITDFLTLKAPLASPVLTGTPTSTTPDISDNSTRIATTAFVQSLSGGLVTRGSFVLAANTTTTTIVNPTGVAQAVFVQVYDSNLENCWVESSISAASITLTFTAQSSARTFYYIII